MKSLFNFRILKLFTSRIYLPKIEKILVFFNFSENDRLRNDDDVPLQMPANQNLCSALAVARSDLLQIGILKNFWAAINQWRVGSHFYSSFLAELPQLGLTEVGVTLDLRMILLRQFSAVNQVNPTWLMAGTMEPFWMMASIWTLLKLETPIDRTNPAVTSFSMASQVSV